MIKTMRKEKCSSKNKKHRGGFTLVELIVVLVILAILAALLIPALTGYIDKAKKKQVVAETRMIHSAIQTVVAEVYASDEWEEYANKASGNPDNAIANKTGQGKVKERYEEIVRLAEVPALGSNGKFCSLVTDDGKVMVIIYNNGKGQIGIYFGQTQECIAYDVNEFGSPDAYFKSYKESVQFANRYDNKGNLNLLLIKDAILYSMSYQQ